MARVQRGQDLDISTRVVWTAAEAEKWSVVVENKPGASQVLGGAEVLRSDADGHTLYNVSLPIAAAPALQSKVGFDLQADFRPVIQLAAEPVGGAPAVFGNLLASEVDKWGQVIKTAGINPHRAVSGSDPGKLCRSRRLGRGRFRPRPNSGAGGCVGPRLSASTQPTARIAPTIRSIRAPRRGSSQRCRPTPQQLLEAIPIA